MNSTKLTEPNAKITTKIKIALENELKKYPSIKDIITKIYHQNGRALLVGGAVRDLLLGLPIKDIDIEVHGLSMDKLEKILKQFGPVSLVGKSFGVLRLAKLDVDWSLPRADSRGRKPTVEIDPTMDIKDAFSRRDLTINAMGIDLNTFELIDPFNGKQDLKNKLLRAPDINRFVEDPLRFFRVMQFISRFGTHPDKELTAVCKKMDINSISLERIEAEFEKLLLRSQQPSLGIRWLQSIGRLAEVLPELAATVNTIQGKDVHPEGNVFEHSMQALDAAAQQKYASDEQKLMLLLAALSHDLGKPETTEEVDGKIRSYGHEQVGAKIAKKMLKRITGKKQLIDDVCLLVRYHMMPMQFIQGKAKPSAYKRLARKLAPRVSLSMLAQLALADTQGRNGKSNKPMTKNDKTVAKFLEQARAIQVHEHHEEPILQGRDILEVVEPGPKMGELLNQAYEIQIEEGIQDKEELKRRVLNKKQ